MKFSLGQLADLRQVLKELATGLNRLDLLDNFISFEAEITIAATTEYKLRNELSSIPTKMLITKQVGNGLVTASSTTPWNLDHLYLYNNGAESVTINVIFFK